LKEEKAKLDKEVTEKKIEKETDSGDDAKPSKTKKEEASLEPEPVKKEKSEESGSTSDSGDNEKTTD